MDILQGKWKQLTGEMKRQWGRLTDDDLLAAEGDAEKLLGLLQERYGYERAQAEKELELFLAAQR